jgi:ATP-dependent Clp protease ATP-binding subunit ClpB
MSSLKDYFRPEFLNRLDDIVIFDVLSKEVIAQIVELQVDVVKKRLAEKGIELQISKEAYEYLAKEGYNPQYGARPLKRIIQNKILTPVASFMISQGLTKGGTITVSLKKDSKGNVVVPEEFVFDIRKKKKGESGLILSGIELKK